MVEQLLVWLASAEQRRLTAETMRAYQRQVEAFARWLETSLDAARRLHAQAEQPTPPKALSATIVRRVLDAAHHTGALRDAVIVELLAKSDLRASKAAGIQLEDLEWAPAPCGSASWAKDGNGDGYHCPRVLGS